MSQSNRPEIRLRDTFMYTSSILLICVTIFFLIHDLRISWMNIWGCGGLLTKVYDKSSSQLKLSGFQILQVHEVYI